MRNQLNWKFDKLSEQDKKSINEWLDNQQNKQNSLANVILHMINIYGTQDIMDFSIQQKLYNQDLSSSEPIKKDIENSSMPTENIKTETYEIDNTEEIISVEDFYSTDIANSL